MAATGWHVCFPLFLTTTVLLLSLYLAYINHFDLPVPSQPDAPADEFSEGRAQQLLQLATRSVRTLGSCDNEVAAPLLFYSFIREKMLMLAPPFSDQQAVLAKPTGAEIGAVVGRLSYVLLVTHAPRSAAAAEAAAAAAAAAARLHRIYPSGQVTEIETCLCEVQQEHLLLLEQQEHLLLLEQKQHHTAAAAAAAAAAGLPNVLLQQTQEELPPLCSKQQQQTTCAAAVARAQRQDLFFSSAAAEHSAAFEAKGAAEIKTAATSDTWDELGCMDSPPLLDPNLPHFVPGTIIPRVQCFKVTRHFLSPPSTVSALIGLAIKEQQQQQQEQQQQQPAAAADTPQPLEREKGEGRGLRPSSSAKAEGLRRMQSVIKSLSNEAKGNYTAAAAAATAAAAAAGIPVLQHLSHFLLSLDVGLWGGASGGFSLNYLGMRTALYVGLLNLTVEIKPFLPSVINKCNMEEKQIKDAALPPTDAQKAPAERGVCTPEINSSNKGRKPATSLMLAAHFDSAPSSPGISDDLGMCAVALEVARAGVYRHLRASHALQLQEWGFEEKKKKGWAEELLPSPLIINLNGAEETMLQASHAFASQHPAARRVKLAVNLEAAGSRGKSFVLQMPQPLAGPLLGALSSLTFPNASAAASDVWNSGQFPGETDFRIWAEVLGVPGGLDLAWIGEGSAYHTIRDTLSSMHPGSLQHTGNTILSLLHPLLRIAAAADSTQTAEQQNSSSSSSSSSSSNSSNSNSSSSIEIPFYQDVLGKKMLIIPWEWFLPLLLLVVVLLLLSYKLQQKVLGVAVSPPLLLLSCLTFGISCLAAAAAACCCSVLGALLLQLHGPLYVHWPAAAAWRVAVAFATFLWCWHRTLFSPLASRFPLSRHPLLAQHAARAGPLAMLLPLVLALHRMRLFSCFYLLLLLLGLVGPRVFLLLFWLSRQGEPNPNKRSSNHQTNNHSNERKNSSNQQNVIATKIQRGSALLIADALGAAFPSLLFFQAYLAFLDGVSGPAGRSGEFLLFADVLLNAAVLLPVVLLLPATLSPSLLHLFDYCGRLRAAASPLRPKQLRKRNARWKIKVYFILGAAAALLAAVWLSNVELSIHPREEFPKDIEPSAMEEAAGNWGPWQLLKQPTEWLSFLQHKFQGPLLGAPQGDPQGGLPRSILGFLPMRLRRFLTDVLFFPSGEYPFSFERPLQLHFVSFRRSKVIAKKLLNGGSSSSSKGDKMEAAAAGFRFSPELEQLANTDPSAHLVRHSTQGVAVLGLGSQTFGNPAAQDINKVLSAVRKAVLAAEETAATGGQTPQKASAAGANKNAAEAPGTETAAIRVAPSFLLKEEAPSPNAPLTLAHLHRHSINRTHWSVYTDAQAFLTPKKPTERTRVYSPGIRGEVDIQYESVLHQILEKTDETKFSLLIGGGSLLVIALPAAGVKGWNLEQQAPLQRLKECDCYMVTIITPAPPVMTKLEFFFHGKVPVRFTTRSGVFDAMAPNWNCSQTLLSRFVQSSFPFEHAAELQQKHSLPVPPSEQNANETSSSGLDGSDAFWERLLASLPPHIAAAGSSADAAEWMLPEAPFKASFVF